MKKVFLDTAELIGLWDVDDQWHDVAAKAFDKISARRARTFTTTYVLLECGNAAARTPFRLVVDRLREQLDHEGKLLTPTEEDWRTAWANYRADAAGGAGIIDHVSFTVMRRLGMTDAFTNDRHFRVAGFKTLF